MMNCRYIFIIVTTLVLSGLLTDARAIGNVDLDLRCKCIRTTSVFISPKHMKNLKVITHGPHCHTTEVIATLRNGMKRCLNPETQWVQKMLRKLKDNETKIIKNI
ncbi:permeability factor 2-like [Hypanus sabinus]|uniref:permeability factor 2-like n=1 Tax=Hypanus sabinus TaxID=79690 RepID=UPI0028C489D2|nr:permeability factor 2-like [Hypanus sabinus]